MKYRLLLGCIVGGLLSIVALAGFSAAQPSSSAIVDVSWPNCRYHPQRTYRIGIVGATGGLNFRPNPCLEQEASWFNYRAAYMNTAFPGIRNGNRHESPLLCAQFDMECGAYNYGYQAADYALKYAASQGLQVGFWWLDVETENSWTTDLTANRAALTGAVEAVHREAFYATVGFYSTPYQWNVITGGWHNKLPVWVGTGQLSATKGAEACKGTSFTGGPVLLGQYTDTLDMNVVCSDIFTGRVTGWHR